MRVVEALAEALVAEGTEVVFGVLGDGNLELVAELVEGHGVRYVAARHEAGAVAMADGYARASRRPGVATVTHGPGLTQVGTPLTAARLARSPVVLVAGDTPLAARLHGQNIDQAPFALATAGALQPLRTPATVAEDVWLAFRHVRSGAGPLVLNAGVDVQEAEVAAPWSYRRAEVPAPPRPAPEPSEVAAVAAFAAGCARPVVLAGRGAVAAGAREALMALADRLGAPLATTLLAAGWFRGHPRDLGVCGGFSTPEARGVLSRADGVLAFGASLNRFTVDSGRLFGEARLAHVDLDPRQIGDPVPVDLAVIADARRTAEALLGAFPGPARPPWAAVVPADPVPAPPVPDLPDGLDPRAALRACDALLPSERAVVVGIGHYSGWGALGLAVEDPRDLVLPWQLGAVGLGLPVGLEVAVARPDRTTVVVEGDGGLLMSLPELETAAREGVPLVVVVLDDRAYGAEVHLLARMGRSDALARFANPDLAAVARSLGVRAVSATTEAELRSALADLGPPVDGPVVVHVRTSTSVVHDAILAALGG